MNKITRPNATLFRVEKYFLSAPENAALFVHVKTQVRIGVLFNFWKCEKVGNVGERVVDTKLNTLLNAVSDYKRRTLY